MSHYAFLSRSEALTIPVEEVSDNNNQDKSSSLADVRQDLASIYESYAELYPNPRLQEEYKERDKLLKAASAANYASGINPSKKKQKGGIWSYLFGQKDDEADVGSSSAPTSDNELIVFKDKSIEEDDGLCGTQHSLDISCIPQEAISAARFHLASTQTRRDRPNVVRPSSLSASAEENDARALVVVSLGVIVEFCQGIDISGDGIENGAVAYTSDREDLLEYVASGRGSFDVSYVRAISVAENFLAVSWGLMDGIVVFYRRIKGGGWKAVQLFGPTPAILDNLSASSDGMFLEEPESTLLIVTDIVPLVVQAPGGSEIPAVSLAVSRLGGYIEVFPIPSQLWFGPELPPDNQRANRKRRRQRKPEHYAVGKVESLGSAPGQQNLVVPISTSDYHIDAISLDAFRTRVDLETEWNTQAYANSPPAEYVLVASGLTQGSESLSFWAVSAVFPEEQDPNLQHVTFSVHVRLLEAIDLGPVGADVSIFANKSIMKNWRVPRLVELRDGAEKSLISAGHSVTQNNEMCRVTTISAPAPIIAMSFTVSSTPDSAGALEIMLALLDWNGSVTIMDCSLLERVASHCLSIEEYNMVYVNENPEGPLPLVQRVASRSRVMRYLPSPSSAVNVRWLKLSNTEASSLLLLTKKPNKVVVFSKFNHMATRSDAVPALTVVPFPAGEANFDRSHSAIPYILSFQRRKSERLLCYCRMQPLQPRDIIKSLAHVNKYKEAMEAAKALSTEDQKDLLDVIENCKQKIWKQSLDLNILEEVSDDSYILNEALSLFEDDDNVINIQKSRAICMMALKRADQMPGDTSIMSTGEPLDIMQVIHQVRNYLILLGTYEILCRHFGVEMTKSRFQRNFLKPSIADLAISFARTTDIMALTVLFFRHRKEIIKKIFDILDEIPLAVGPSIFRHLLPVDKEVGGFTAFLSTSADSPRLHWSHLNAYMNETARFDLTLGPEDEKMILNHNSDSVLTMLDEDSDTTKIPIVEWYINRARKMQEYVGNLQQVADLCALGQAAVDFSPNKIDEGELDAAVEKLHAVWGCASSLQWILADRLQNPKNSESSLSPPVALTVNPDDLLTMDLVDIVRSVLSDRREPIEICHVYKNQLLPLLNYFPKASENQIDQAVKTYCIRLLQDATQVKNDQDQGNTCRLSSILEEVEKSLVVCATIASGSRSSIKKQGRLLKDKKILLELVLSICFDAAVACKHIMEPSRSCRRIVDLMWEMYESLPTQIHSTEKENASLVSSMVKAELIYQDLVGVDILSRWPGCHPFAFLVKRHEFRVSDDGSISNEEGLLSEETKNLGQNVVADMCRAFCVQLGPNPDDEETSGLLRLLVSDIEQLVSICYSGLLPVTLTLSSHLLTPLLRKQQFHLIADFISKADDCWVDHGREAMAILSYVEDAVLSEDNSRQSCDRNDMIQAALRCQDVLGPIFPSLNDDFASIRGHLDAAHFINTTIFQGMTNTFIRPESLRRKNPLDVIEFVLNESPRTIVCGCEDWADEKQAVDANHRLRSHYEEKQLGYRAAKAKASFDLPQETYDLPPLPGGAIFHLASILGLVDVSSALAVKCRVIHYSIIEGLYGSSAAICRSLFYDEDPFCNKAHSLAKIASVAELVTNKNYADLETKLELCVTVLKRYNGSISGAFGIYYGIIVKVFGELELQTNQSQLKTNRGEPIKMDSPMNTVDRFCVETWGQYSVDVRNMLFTLQQQASGCVIDDSLLNALCRYMLFWCIFHSTKARSTMPNVFETDAESSFLALGLSFLLHIYNKDISRSTMTELQNVLEGQAIEALNRYPARRPVLHPDLGIVRKLTGRGYSENGSRRCALATQNVSFEAGLQWAISHSFEPGFDDPILNVSLEDAVIDEFLIQRARSAFSLSFELLENKKSIKEVLLGRADFSSGKDSFRNLGVNDSKYGVEKEVQNIQQRQSRSTETNSAKNIPSESRANAVARTGIIKVAPPPPPKPKGFSNGKSSFPDLSETNDDDDIFEKEVPSSIRHQLREVAPKNSSSNEGASSEKLTISVLPPSAQKNRPSFSNGKSSFPDLSESNDDDEFFEKEFQSKAWHTSREVAPRKTPSLKIDRGNAGVPSEKRVAPPPPPPPKNRVGVPPPTSKMLLTSSNGRDAFPDLSGENYLNQTVEKSSVEKTVVTAPLVEKGGLGRLETPVKPQMKLSEKQFHGANTFSNSKPVEAAKSDDKNVNAYAPRQLLQNNKTSISNIHSHDRATGIPFVDTTPGRSLLYGEEKSAAPVGVSPSGSLLERLAAFTSPDRSSLLQHGSSALRMAKTSPMSPEGEERRKLIEDGRRLLAMARAARGSKVQTSSSATTVLASHKGSIGASNILFREGQNQGTPHQASAASAPKNDNSETNKSEAEEEDGGWDFDDFDDDL